MTAEIAILNKNAVAMAADSAVTIAQPQASKIYNTANKLFMLSKYEPVGIMIFGNAQFMSTPWESIIKVYRSKLGKTRFSTLEEYAKAFLAFFETENILFPPDLQAVHFKWLIEKNLAIVQRQIDAQIKDFIAKNSAIDESQTSEIRAEDHREQFPTTEKFPESTSLQ